jgi:hypothetical protein
MPKDERNYLTLREYIALLDIENGNTQPKEELIYADDYM